MEELTAAIHSVQPRPLSRDGDFTFRDVGAMEFDLPVDHREGDRGTPGAATEIEHPPNIRCEIAAHQGNEMIEVMVDDAEVVALQNRGWNILETPGAYFADAFHKLPVVR